jgi:hypothetical protein
MPRFTPIVAAAALAAAVLPTATAAAHPRPVPAPADIAVIGDTPYGAARIGLFGGDVAQINADPTVSQVVHVGDIKNGSSRCDTSYFEQIRADFDQFQDPLVYTPGDNEWTDCHRANNGGYQPAGPQVDGPPVVTAGPSRLSEIRRIFFDRPGLTLGQHAMPVATQGRALPENVAWSTAGVQFGVLNVPGSDNDALPWFGDQESDRLARVQRFEVASRTAADVAWLHGIFTRARISGARAVAIGIQADMWDPEITGDATQYAAFTPIVRALAVEARAFGRPVLLLNGDSHSYESDHPLADPAAANSTIYGVPFAVPNLLRITVDGSNNADDYLKLHLDASSDAVFSWQRVPLTR